MADSTVLVVGDPTVDQVLLTIPPRGGNASDTLASYPNYVLWQQRGGVHLAKPALEANGLSVKLDAIERENGKILNSLVSIKCIKHDGRTEEFGDAVHSIGLPAEARIDRFEGYFESTGAAYDCEQVGREYEAFFPYVLLVDAGGATRTSQRARDLLAHISDESCWVIHKMHLPLSQSSPLRDWCRQRSGERKLLLVSAEDLRLEGIRLRSHLSWDAVVDDILGSLDYGSLVADLLGDYRTVCIQFGVEAVAVLRRLSGSTILEMYVDTVRAEGDLAHEHPGDLYGKMNAFACALIAAIDDSGGEGLDEAAVPAALGAARRYAQGRIKVSSLLSSDIPAWPVPKLDRDQTSDFRKTIRRFEFEHSDRPSIRKTLLISSRTEDFQSLARKIVRHGKKEIDALPSAKIKDFRTVDRDEIESFRTIQRLIDRYLADKTAVRPVSIGVFGPPGAGKSFGIKQIARQRGIPTREFNLSEASPEALPGYFHEMRDIVLRGETPLCFFDEFDSHGCSLVSRFLAPMQDGEFREGGRVHPVGRAIFVFAGGTAATAGDFVAGEMLPNVDRVTRAKELKLPDFVSRLSGVIDILGPNRSGENDRSYVLRRAVLLRGMIERLLPRIVADGEGEADVEETVVDAFLGCSKFLYGARSMEQIVRMSALRASQSRYGVSDLPDASRLKLHIEDAEGFLDIAYRRSGGVARQA
ncbi:AAA family ATPase [Aquibium sp. ELW1220]|uniref:AAA family ATPase n=1 Tax=Aquibium sp. ELW1220 TaxID=2976766 RepID=UPI0025B07D31|nr:AAA family ATPase [Aquibium sp. ELW1220]MDN2579026.1 hypothetical protein [Aquibium sp. ELW1220]